VHTESELSNWQSFGNIIVQVTYFVVCKKADEAFLVKNVMEKGLFLYVGLKCKEQERRKGSKVVMTRG